MGRDGMGQEARGGEGSGADQRARGVLGIGKVALDRQLDGHREQQAREHLPGMNIYIYMYIYIYIYIYIYHGITKHT